MEEMQWLCLTTLVMDMGQHLIIFAEEADRSASIIIIDSAFRIELCLGLRSATMMSTHHRAYLAADELVSCLHFATSGEGRSRDESGAVIGDLFCKKKTKKQRNSSGRTHHHMNNGETFKGPIVCHPALNSILHGIFILRHAKGKHTCAIRRCSGALTEETRVYPQRWW